MIQNAIHQGVTTIIEIADGPDEWAKAKTLAEKHKGVVWWAAGVHPYYSDISENKFLPYFKEMAFHPQFVAIGEIGLDYAKCPIPPDIQKKTFESSIHCAMDLEKPMIIHCREAFQDLIPILRAYFSKNKITIPGVIHCFSGPMEVAEELIEMGFLLGFDGPVTYPKSEGLREVISRIPLTSILLETDSPYLPPQGFRGQRNEPAHLALIGTYISNLRKISPRELAVITRQNSEKFFRLKIVAKSV